MGRAAFGAPGFIFCHGAITLFELGYQVFIQSHEMVFRFSASAMVVTPHQKHSYASRAFSASSSNTSRKIEAVRGKLVHIPVSSNRDFVLYCVVNIQGELLR